MGIKETTEENAPLTEQEAREFWRKLKSFIENPDYRFSLRTSASDAITIFDEKGFKFRHIDPKGSNTVYDSYAGLGLRTKFLRLDGTVSSPGFNISVRYPCEIAAEHEPSPIPDNTPIQLALAGMLGFIIDGSLEGSGGLDRKGKVSGPLSRATLNELQGYLAKAYFNWIF